MPNQTLLEAWNSCFDCQASINHRATRCRSCATRHRMKKAA